MKRWVELSLINTAALRKAFAITYAALRFGFADRPSLDVLLGSNVDQQVIDGRHVSTPDFTTTPASDEF